MNAQNSILDVEVSCFAGYGVPTDPKPVNLLAWLQSDKYATQVLHLRGIENDDERNRLKAKLPAITPSGTFTRREADCLTSHSGFLQFDIDLKENVHLANYDDLKTVICQLPEVAYCGLSASGQGFWGLVPIAHPEKHSAHFDALKLAFARGNINLDGKPRNVASLRGYSFDPDGYFNHQAATFRALRQPTPPRPFRSAATPTDEQAAAEHLIGEILQRRQDLTAGYGAWFELGCALANTFGEGGRDYFHQISQFHEKYNANECDRQFTNCLKKDYRFSFGTFVHYCQLADIQPLKRTQSNDFRATAIVTPPVDRTAGTGAKPDFSGEKQEYSHDVVLSFSDEIQTGADEPPVSELAEAKPAVRFSIAHPEAEEPAPGAWDVQELESYFAAVALPTTPVRLNGWTVLNDPALFVRSHLAIVRASNSTRVCLPYFDRLTAFRALLQQHPIAC